MEMLPGTFPGAHNYKCFLKAGHDVQPEKYADKTAVYCFTAGKGYVTTDKFARNITELAFDYLDAPAVVLGSRDWITPAYELEYAFFPQPDSFLDIIHEKIVPLQGYVPTRNYTDAEQIRRAKEGI